MVVVMFFFFFFVSRKDYLPLSSEQFLVMAVRHAFIIPISVDQMPY